MNITDIIREEHELCQARIAERVAALLMGGVTGAPAPRALPPAPRVYEPAARHTHADFADRQTPITLTADGRRSGAATGDSHNAKQFRQTQEDLETVIAYLQECPGSVGVDIMQRLGCSGGMDRRYINVTKKMRSDPRIMARGKGRMTVYYFNADAPIGGTPAPVRAKGQGQGRSGNAAVPVKDAGARDDKLVAYVKAHPGLPGTELRDHFKGKPGMGTGEALNSAIHRLCMKGRIKKKPSNKTGRGGQPVMELRVK